MNKRERLNLIKELVVRYPIDTQEEIVERLKEMGVHATQATVSRDIKELGIIKVPAPDKGYIYGLPKMTIVKSTFSNVLSCESMENMLNINLVPGSTSAVKRQIMEQFEEYIFSIIADDSSILVFVKDKEILPRIEQVIKVW